MSTISLPVVFSNATSELEALVALLLRSDYPLGAVQRVWRNYRIRGAVQLFLTGSASGFCDNLQKSAQVGARHLRLRGFQGLALSRVGPLFDAVACGNPSIADELARLCADAPHVSDLEYLEDYLYVKYLMSSWTRDRAVASDALLQLTRLIDGGDSSQLAVCDAVESLDAVALGDALAMRLDEHDERYRLLLERGAVTEDEWVSEAQLSFEGLAIVRLADRLGIALESNYKFVPSVVIRARSDRLPDDAWQQP